MHKPHKDLPPPDIDSVDGHPIAYHAILQLSDGYENRRVFLREDSEPVVSDPIMSEKAPEWMATSKQVATGNRKRVLENGDDKMNSSDEDDPKMQPDEEKGMYTAGMDPEKGPVKLSPAQAAAQRAAAKVPKQRPPRVQSPLPPTGSSDDDDDPESPKTVWSQSRQIFRPNKHWRDPSALALPAPDVSDSEPMSVGTRGNPVMGSSPAPRESRPTQSQKALPAPERQPTPVSSDTEDQFPQTEDQKRLTRFGKKKATASQRAPADQPKGAKAPPPTSKPGS
jgi:hypothetical protein